MLGETMVEKIVLAEPRGFCAGVERAVEVVRNALKAHGRPLYVRHQIVHNRFVLEALESEGAIFVENLDEVPERQRVIFSAHGVAPSEWARAGKRDLRVIDATCPLVTKVHLEVERYARDGLTGILIGRAGPGAAGGQRRRSDGDPGAGSVPGRGGDSDHAQRGRYQRDHGGAQASLPRAGDAQDRRYLLRDPESAKRGQRAARSERRNPGGRLQAELECQSPGRGCADARGARLPGGFGQGYPAAYDCRGQKPWIDRERVVARVAGRTDHRDFCRPWSQGPTPERRPGAGSLPLADGRVGRARDEAAAPARPLPDRERRRARFSRR